MLKFSFLSHPLKDFRGRPITNKIYLWLDGKRIVEFLLVIKERFC